MPTLEEILNKVERDLTGQTPRPPVNTGFPTLDKVLEFIAPKTPGQAVGFPGAPAIAGTIAPATFKAMAPQAKAMINTLANAFPESFAQVLKHPRELMAFVGKLDPGVAGRLTRTDLPGGLKAAQATVVPGAAASSRTSAHEILGHLLAEGRLDKTSPRAQEAFGILEDILPTSTTGSLRLRTQQLRDMRAGNFKSANEEVVSRLPQYERDLQRVIMDEALASIAEAQTLPQVSPIVKQIIKRLGLELK